jgi:hypothetical protein
MDGGARLPLEAWYFDVPVVTRAFITASVLTSIAVVQPQYGKTNLPAMRHGIAIPIILQLAGRFRQGSGIHALESG